MSNARQLLELNVGRSLRRLAEDLKAIRSDVDEGMLRACGCVDTLNDLATACAQVPFDCDTAEMPIGVWDDTTEPTGVHNR